MKTLSFLKKTIAVLALVGVVLPPQYSFAANPNLPAGGAENAPATRIADVTLGERGTLRGQVVDANGKPKANCEVSVEQAGQVLGKTKADAQGRFAIDNLRGGVCQLNTAGMASNVRCWTANAAPPSSKGEVLVLADEAVQRGQRPIGEILTNPLLIGAVIAAAIIIPIAVHNSQDSGS